MKTCHFKKISTAVTAVIFYLSSPTVMGAARLPLEPYHPKVEATGPDYSLVTNAAGDYVMRYLNGRKPAQVVFEPPNKVRLTVAAAVSADGRGGFIYAYTLATLATSPQSVHAFIVDFEGAVFDIKSPLDWTSRPVKFMPAITWYPNQPGTKSDQAVSGFAMSSSARPSVGKLEEGGKVGFTAYSGTLPGIVQCHALGNDHIVTFEGEPPGPLGIALPRYPYSGVGGRTVGPVARPKDGLKSWIIERLRKYVRESSDLGWIEGEGVVQKYLQLLDQIGERMGKKAWAELNVVLAAFGLQVKADFEQGKLTSEADALLGHNIQFLKNLLAEEN